MTVQPLEVQRSRTCAVCAEQLPWMARKCTKCDSYQGSRLCGICGLPLDDFAVRCSACNTYFGGKDCVSCGAPLRPGARKCAACGTYQNWRRAIPGGEVVLALMISLISVVTAVAPTVLRAVNYRSKTYVRLIGSKLAGEPKGLVALVLVANDGGRPAVVQNASVSFPNLPIKSREVDIFNPEARLVQPNKTVMLQLFADQFETPRAKSALQDAIAKGTGEVTVTIKIDEVGLFGTRRQVDQSDTTAARVVKNWIMDHVADR